MLNAQSLKENIGVPVVVCALYKFVPLTNYQSLHEPLLDVMNRLQIYGTLLLAREGINGTVAGSREGIDKLLQWLKRDERLASMEVKESYTRELPFHYTRVKLKKEIVTMGVEGVDPSQMAGTYVEPEMWNRLISDPDVVVIDTRNEYEVNVGTFQGAINPHTDSFRQFPEYVQQNLVPRVGKKKKVAMFCTGGIRCEKSTAYLRQQGFEEVYHLKGGILKYLERVPEQNSLWQGECFVFDDRVTVNHSLERGAYEQCCGCRLPITEEDKRSDQYQQGVSCPHCYDKLTPQQKERFSQREKQIQLAKLRGESHRGRGAQETISKRRKAKITQRSHKQNA